LPKQRFWLGREYVEFSASTAQVLNRESWNFYWVLLRPPRKAKRNVGRQGEVSRMWQEPPLSAFSVTFYPHFSWKFHSMVKMRWRNDIQNHWMEKPDPNPSRQESDRRRSERGWANRKEGRTLLKMKKK